MEIRQIMQTYNNFYQSEDTFNSLYQFYLLD